MKLTRDKIDYILRTAIRAYRDNPKTFDEILIIGYDHKTGQVESVYSGDVGVELKPSYESHKRRP